MPMNLKLTPVVRMVRALQLENMLLILVTLQVSNDVTSKLVNLLQPSNILLIFVTL